MTPTGLIETGMTATGPSRRPLALDLALEPFAPASWARGAHVQTLLAHLLPSQRLPGWGVRAEKPRAQRSLRAESKRLETRLDTRLDEIWRIPLPTRIGEQSDAIVAHHIEGRKSTVVYLFHGLSGESHGSYMQRSALVALDLGYSVVISNHRGCGEGAGLAVESYHSGRSADMGAVIAAGRGRYPKHRHVAVGFSMSGNILLMLAARQRLNPDSALPDAALAVNAPIELARASKALKTGLNRLYDANFMLTLREDVRDRKRRGQPVPPTIETLGWRSTCWDFDEAYTAPANGFRDREDYYRSCSAFPHLHALSVPTAVLTAADDPFVPVDSYRRAEWSKLAHVRVETHGGHLGYLSQRATPLGTHRWLDWAVHQHLVAFDRLLGGDS